MGRDEQSGSSLIELLVVFCAITILMTLVVGHAPLFKKYAVRTEMDKIRSAFWYLNQKALSDNRPCLLTFDLKNNTYTVDQQMHTLPRGITFGAPAWVKGPPSEPKTSIASGVTFKDQQVVFNPNGTISSGTVYLEEDKGKNIYALTLPVGLIGYIRLYCYQQGWKLLE